MTPPPSVLPGSQTGFRKTRRRAPVSDRPVVGLLAASSLPTRGDPVSEKTPEVIYVGLDWAAAVHAVFVMSAAGKVLARFTVEHGHLQVHEHHRRPQAQRQAQGLLAVAGLAHHF